MGSNYRKTHVHDATVRDSDLSEAKLSDRLKKVDPALAALMTEKSLALTTKVINHYIQEAKRNDDSKFELTIQGK